MLHAGIVGVKSFLEKWVSNHGTHSDNLVIKVIVDSMETGIDLTAVTVFGRNLVPQTSLD